MRVPITLVPGGVIPRDPNMTIRLRRLTPTAPPAAVAATEPDTPPPEEIAIDAGADNFADATEIPYQEFRDVVAAYTYSKNFSTEVDEPKPQPPFIPGRKSAWWKVKIPFPQEAYLDVDTQLSFGAPGQSVDTVIAVYALEATPDETNFSNLVQLKHNDDDNGGDGFWSRIEALYMDNSGSVAGNEWFYIQVCDYNDGDPGICYVVRFSLRFTPYGTVPDDGVDPSGV